MCPCFPIAIELPLQALEEKASAASADYNRQIARLKSLIADFDRVRLTASAQVYALLRGEVEQQELIVANAEQANARAERELANARLEHDRQQAEARKEERRKVLQTELEIHETRLNEYHALHRSLPERIELERQAHSALLAELASL